MPKVSTAFSGDVGTPVNRGPHPKEKVSNQKYLYWSLLTLAGFAAAAIISLTVPNTQDVRDTAYRFALLGLIVLYTGVAVYSFFDPARRLKLIKRAPFRLAMGIVLLAWDLLSTKLDILPMPFFPGPSKVAGVVLEEYAFLLSNTGYSLRLFLCGFLAGIVLGVGTGILIGWFSRVHYWVFPALKITGVVPAVAWMPFALTIFPTSFMAGVFIIAISAWFPVAYMTSQGIANTHKVYFEVAKTLGAKQSYLLFRVALPNAVPQIFTGISTANGLAFTTLVISEMMGAKGGLGYYINWAKAWSSYYKVYAAIIVMAVLFSLIMKLIALIQSRLLIWQRGLVK
ncbi:binding-protein-dependent transport systems inner membrane component [Syntrophobotulus glycolicus DSM 8271]|uniref:Binding-protein-dependent transport systems inner membrane component n=1 Tax=Syntrophobotulus glycolicus (strain DSM 8271 / FlGlyR) TaxID=645991 RepID=F0SWH6_SYNGF|nr:ABC transporter permease [Syntrophobotulus glycolicus]ADY55742.1 binding-protein-dependent transport systems inner membrane component [Syntrophobotulus glycolicus DSM 8271]